MQPIASAPEIAMATRLLADAEASLDRDVDEARTYLRQLARLIGGPADRVVAPAGPVRGGLAPWQVRRVLAHVEAHLDGTVTVGALAGVAQLSNGHFCRAFKATLGMTPHTYVVRQRIERAQTMMLTTRETLGHIAAACGLTDQAHLTRLFRRYVGTTPLSWRRTFRPDG